MCCRYICEGLHGTVDVSVRGYMCCRYICEGVQVLYMYL